MNAVFSPSGKLVLYPSLNNIVCPNAGQLSGYLKGGDQAI